MCISRHQLWNRQLGFEHRKTTNSLWSQTKFRLDTSHAEVWVCSLGSAEDLAICVCLLAGDHGVWTKMTVNSFTWVKRKCKSSGCILYGSEIQGRGSLHSPVEDGERLSSVLSAVVLKSNVLAPQLFLNATSVMLGLWALPGHFSLACRLFFFPCQFQGWTRRLEGIFCFLTGVWLITTAIN